MASKKPSLRARARRPDARQVSARALRGTGEPFQDFVDVIAALGSTGARFLVVGAYAMAAHGVPRATGDLDIWVDPTPQNAPRVYEALVRFGAPLRSLGITAADFASAGPVCQIGLPPRRIDVTTIIDGVDFTTAWEKRLEGSLGSARADYIGREALLTNKVAAGRPKDVADVQLLRAATPAAARRGGRRGRVP